MHRIILIFVFLIGIIIIFGAVAASEVGAPWEFNLLEETVDSYAEHQPILRETSTLKILVGFMYKIWVKQITPQDANKCSFYPTCASYIKQAIDKYGFFKGAIMGFDRLQRCHCWTVGEYPIRKFGNSYRLYDPVK